MCIVLYVVLDRGGPDFRDPRGFDRGRGPPDDRRGPPESRSGPSERPPDPRSGPPRTGPPDPRNARGPDPGPRRDRLGGPPPHNSGPEERFSGPPSQWNKGGPPPAPPATAPAPSVPTSQANPVTGDVTSQEQEKVTMMLQSILNSS